MNIVKNSISCTQVNQQTSDKNQEFSHKYLSSKPTCLSKLEIFQKITPKQSSPTIQKTQLKKSQIRLMQNIIQSFKKNVASVALNQTLPIDKRQTYIDFIEQTRIRLLPSQTLDQFVTLSNNTSLGQKKPTKQIKELALDLQNDEQLINIDLQMADFVNRNGQQRPSSIHKTTKISKEHLNQQMGFMQRRQASVCVTSKNARDKYRQNVLRNISHNRAAPSIDRLMQTTNAKLKNIKLHDPNVDFLGQIVDRIKNEDPNLENLVIDSHQANAGQLYLNKQKFNTRVYEELESLHAEGDLLLNYMHMNELKQSDEELISQTCSRNHVYKEKTNIETVLEKNRQNRKNDYNNFMEESLMKQFKNQSFNIRQFLYRQTKTDKVQIWKPSKFKP